MSDFDKTNTAIAFIEGELFNQTEVDALGKRPVLSLKVDIDGEEKEISLWFATDKLSGQHKLTVKGHRMLTGKVSDPFVPDVTKTTATATADMPL
jgi:hypothetical protein